MPSNAPTKSFATVGTSDLRSISDAFQDGQDAAYACCATCSDAWDAANAWRQPATFGLALGNCVLCKDELKPGESWNEECANCIRASFGY